MTSGLYAGVCHSLRALGGTGDAEVAIASVVGDVFDGEEDNVGHSN